MSAMTSPPIAGDQEASWSRMWQSSAKSEVSAAPPTRSVRTARRITCPRSTGTTKVAPKPMLTTTPEVRLRAKRQSEAESTMATALS
eukprot:jgi/Chrpa1/9192/Chrysochromulina_OHIO_Genome00001490-RA